MNTCNIPPAELRAALLKHWLRNAGPQPTAEQAAREATHARRWLVSVGA